MWGGRAPWLVLATMMSAAAIAVAFATWLHWAPCSGSMLTASMFHGSLESNGFTDACLGRMDSGAVFPFIDTVGHGATGSGATIGSMALLGLGWVGFIATRRWTFVERTLAAAPGLLTAALAVSSFVQVFLPPLWPRLGVVTWIVVAIDLTALVAAAVIVQLTSGLDRAAQLLALWGVTSFGWMRTIGDYMTMIIWSNANWDAPPGTGYVTAATMAASGLVACWLGLRGGRTVTPGPPPTRLPAVLPPAVVPPAG